LASALRCIDFGGGLGCGVRCRRNCRRLWLRLRRIWHWLHYKCLGITCKDVGEFQGSAGVYVGMEACKDPETPAPSSSVAETTAAPVTDESVAVMMGFAMLFFSQQI